MAVIRVVPLAIMVAHVTRVTPAITRTHVTVASVATARVLGAHRAVRLALRVARVTLTDIAPLRLVA